MNKAVFIDKDGTLVSDVPYNVDTALVDFMPDALKVMANLKEMGFLLIMITNQSGVARNLFKPKALQALFDFINMEARSIGAEFDKIYFCPHEAFQPPACECRKPLPGMLLQAGKEFDIDMANSWMIGDILNDVEAGRRAGCKTILLNVGNETEWLKNEYRTPDFTVNNWQEIEDVILKKHLLGNESI